MALKPTIYKFQINLSDLNRNYYDSISLTVAQHPSESLPRMVARVLAFCLNAEPSLEFTRGLSEANVPDIWAMTPDDKPSLWIDVGEPQMERIKKATRRANRVRVYSFNNKSAVWWQQNQPAFATLPVAVYRLQWSDVEQLAGALTRTMDCAVMISGDTLFVSTAAGEYEVRLDTLLAATD